MTPGGFLLAKILAVLALVAAVIFGVHHYNQSLRDEGFKKAEGVYLPRAERAEKALVFSEKERARYEKESKQLAGIADDARTQLAAVRADNAALARTGERLRQQFALYRASQGVASPAPGGGQAADPTADLYADVQRRLDEAAEGIAGFADESRIAGLACQRAHEVTFP